jgi:hypothetical protein
MPHAPVSTHTGVNSNGRRVPVLWFHGQWMQKSDVAAMNAGCTREWATFADVRSNDRAWQQAISVGQNGLVVGQKVRTREDGKIGTVTMFEWYNGKCVKAHIQEPDGKVCTSLPVNLDAV